MVLQIQLNLCISKRAKMALSPFFSANQLVICLATCNFCLISLSFRYVSIILQKLLKTVMQLQLNLCSSKWLKWAKMALSPIPRANYFVICLATNDFFGFPYHSGMSQGSSSGLAGGSSSSSSSTSSSGISSSSGKYLSKSNKRKTN